MADQMQGVADPLTLPEGKILFHGTLAPEFTHEYLEEAGPSPTHYVHPPTPDAPAWFADNEKFSLHAAVRFTKSGKASEIVLHSYRVSKPISMLSLADLESFRIFMQEQYHIEAPFNGLMEGLALAKFSNEVPGTVAWLEGYALLKDAVRGEPEYVLFPSGLKQLSQVEVRTINVVPKDKTHSTLVDASTGKLLAEYTYDGGPGVLV